MTDSDTALVFEIQRFSTEDGPGIRTTVFFKGCPLKCAWCHNPESISRHPEIHWLAVRCVGCRGCVAICPENALAFSGESLRIDRERCTRCGICVEECPSTALEQIGRYWNLPDLVDEVVKDKTYYETSGGGVTVSGGEPTAQAAFTAEFLKRLREQNIHTAIDTCGLCPRRLLDQLLPHADLVMFDIKIFDPAAHQHFTGADNQAVLENFDYLAKSIGRPDRPCELWVRTPIIPGATDQPENIAAIGRHIAAAARGKVTRWELCAFNNLCRDKYDRLGRAWDFAENSCLTAETMAGLADIARASGVDPAIVHWSGSTQAGRDNPAERPALRVIDGQAAVETDRETDQETDRETDR